MVCNTLVPPLTNLDSGVIITRKIIRKPKEGRNICSHLFLITFLQVSWKNAVLLLLIKQMGLIPLEERTTGEEFRRMLLLMG